MIVKESHNCPEPYKETALILSFAVLYGVTAYIFGLTVLQQFPNSADEHAYLFQSEIFASGHITVPAHEEQAFLSPFYIFTHENKVFSIFPPGWSWLLTLGVWLKNPFLLPPLLGAVSLVVLYYFSRNLACRATAWLTVIVTALSPTFLFNSAALFSHPFCQLAVLFVITMLFHYSRQEKPVYAVTAGFLFSIAFSVRELTALAMLALPVFYILYTAKKRFVFLSFFVFAAFPGLLAYGWHCYQTTGTWFLPARFLMPDEGMGFGWREIRLFDYVENKYFGPVEAARNTALNFGRLVLWTFPFMLPVAVVGFWKSRKNAWCCIIMASAMLLIAVYFFYPTDGGNQYGPRFYYEGIPYIALLSVRGFKALGECLGKTLLRLAVLLLLIVNLIQIGSFSRLYQQDIYERRTLYRLVEHRGLRQALVFVGSSSGSMTQGDLIRNSPFPDDSAIIYAWDLGNKNRELKEAFPEREGYFFGYDDAKNTYFLEKRPVQ